MPKLLPANRFDAYNSPGETQKGIISMTKRDTRTEIANAFKESVRKTSLSQTRIADLIAQLGINRNTFYYHFGSKYDVAMWIFRTSLATKLRHDFPESQLVCSPFSETGAGKDSLAYYVHKETGARTLDSGDYYKILVNTVLEDSDFYRKLFNEREVEFMQQIVDMYAPAFTNDIDFILDGRYMPNETKAMLAEVYARQVVTFIGFFLKNRASVQTLLDEHMNPFWNIIQESLYNAIQEHPINRF